MFTSIVWKTRQTRTFLLLTRYLWVVHVLQTDEIGTQPVVSRGGVVRLPSGSGSASTPTRALSCC